MLTQAKTVYEPTTKDATREIILQTSRLFVRNLAFSCTDSDLLELFEPFGEISQVSIANEFFCGSPNLFLWASAYDVNINRDIRPSFEAVVIP